MCVRVAIGGTDRRGERVISRGAVADVRTGHEIKLATGESLDIALLAASRRAAGA